MQLKRLTPELSVAPQIALEDLPAAAAAGFTTLICNRPDGEQPGQPSAESVRAAVEAAGLEFRYVPVVSGQITEQDVADHAAALDSLPGPVFAYCRSGARCANLFALARENRG